MKNRKKFHQKIHSFLFGYKMHETIVHTAHCMYAFFMEALYAMPIGLFIAIGRNFDPSQIIEMNASE